LKKSQALRVAGVSVGRLPRPTGAVTVPVMKAIARLMQLAGLAIPPLAIIAELSHTITLGQMLMFLVASVCLFSLGYLFQQYTGGGSGNG
jgi:hypothetical protein